MRFSVVIPFLLSLFIVPLFPHYLVTGVFYWKAPVGSQISSNDFNDRTGNGSPPLPSPNLATANWTNNRFANPGFESWIDVNNAERWDTFATGDAYAWFAQSPTWPTNASSGYSGGLQVRTISGHATNTYWTQTNINADMRNLWLDFAFYTDQNLYPATDWFYTRLEITSGATSYWLYYWLNGTCPYSNSSTAGYYKIGGPAQTWNSLSRNISLDFEAIPGFPSITPSFLLVTPDFWVQNNGGSTQFQRHFIDDVYLRNDTTTWIASFINDGDFESGGGITNWGHRSNTDAGLVGQSSTAYSGSWSVNLTAQSLGNSSYASINHYPQPRITALNQANLSFWWYLDYTQPATNSWSYLQLIFWDGTQYYYATYHFGYAGVTSFSNTSTMYWIKAPQFNITKTWVNFNRNLWSDLGAYFGINELYVVQVIFIVQATVTNSKTLTLIDKTMLQANAINGGGFEDQDVVGARIRGLSSPYNDYPELLVTSTAYSGSKAANLTLVNGIDLTVFQRMDFRPQNSSRETYLDVMWRLDAYTASVSDYALIRVRFTDGTRLEYYMAYQTLTANSSTYGRYAVSQANTMSTWIQMHRDIVHDYEAVFGTLPDTEIEYVYLIGFTGPSNQLKLLIDDLFYYDDPAPQLSNVQRTPTTPDHNQAVDVTVEASDQDLDTVMLHYRFDGGPWQEIQMLLQITDYEGTIPGQPHNTFVEYYISANDTWTMITLENNGGVYYSYLVTDQTAPSINFVNQLPLYPSNLDDVNITTDVTDSGSGVNLVLLFYRFDGGLWQSDIMSPIGGNNYRTQILVQPYNMLVDYYVNASDNANLITIDDNGGMYYSYTVADAIDPLISSITHTPSQPGYDDPVVVECDVTDIGSGVNNVALYYRLNGGTWVSVAMSDTGGDHYAVTIPTQVWNTVVDYYVNATDNVNNWVVDDDGGTYYGYTVRDITDPTITNLQQTPLIVEYTDSPSISCDVTEDGSGLCSALLYYRINGGIWASAAMTNTGDDTYEANIPIQSFGSFVEYFVNVTDNANNWVLDDNSGSYYNYIVSDSVNPQVSVIGHTPTPVEYSDAPIVSCDATDLGSGVNSVELYYRINSGSWISLIMNLVSGDTYEAIIPAQVYATTIDYYVNASDGANNWALDDNSGLFYSYIVQDYTIPSITNITQTPIEVGPTTTPVVGCDINDLGSGLLTVELYYRVNAGPWLILSLVLITADHYEATIPNYAFGSVVEYYINATDVAGNLAIDDNTGSYYTYTVGDSTPPQITSISRTPTTVEYTDAPIISCNVTDLGSGVNQVLLYYRMNGESWASLTMLLMSSDHYEAAIPTQTWSILVEYYINATDNLNNWILADNSGSYYSYLVADLINPTINIDSPTDGLEVNGTVYIAVLATDDGSGIASVEIFIDSIRIDNDTSYPYSAIYNTTLLTNGSHTISATAYDGAGNSASASITIIVNNTIPTTTTPTSTPSPIPGFPQLAIIIAIIAAVGMGIFLRRRKLA